MTICFILRGIVKMERVVCNHTLHGAEQGLVALLVFESQCHLLLSWVNLKSHITTVAFIFFICKMSQ